MRRAAKRHALLALGILLILLTPAVALLPGPGGIFVFAAGLALVLRTSAWARRRYVRFKRRFPRFGGWADLGLRRPSARRRRARDKAGPPAPLVARPRCRPAPPRPVPDVPIAIPPVPAAIVEREWAARSHPARSD